MNPSRNSVKGVVGRVRVEDIKEPTMREIRYLDKLIVVSLLISAGDLKGLVPLETSCK